MVKFPELIMQFSYKFNKTDENENVLWIQDVEVSQVKHQSK